MGHLIEKICHIDTLKSAWSHVLKKNSRGGIDNLQPSDLVSDIDTTLAGLSNDLKTGRYVPVPYAKGAIPKFNDKNEFRNLSMPSVIDKVVQQAFVSVVGPVFEEDFKDCSYAYRRRKGPVRAIKHLEFYLDTTDVRWTVSMDIDNFFDSMDHQFLIHTIKKKVDDNNILNLVRLWLTAGIISAKGDWDDPDEGIAQGSVVSPLFSNIYLHALDEFALQKGLRYIRYSDNFIIVDENRDRIYIAYEQVNAFLENQLLLKLNENPYPFKEINKGFVFLGIFFKDNLRRISHAKETKIFRKLNYYTEIKHQSDIEKCIDRLNAGIEGKKRYYGFIQPVNQFEAFDQHLIKRLGYLLKHFVQKGMPAGKDDLVTLLMTLVFFVDRSPSDIRSLCQSLANDAFSGASTDNKEKKVKPQTAQTKKATAQKNRYLKQVASQTEVQISTPGTFIGKTSARITVRQNRKNILEVPFSKIKHISIHTSGVSLSSDLVFQCSKSSIPITFYSFKGHPMAVLQSPVHSMGSLSIQQIKTYETERSLELTKRILKGKATNQLNLLKYYRRSRKSESNVFATAVENAIEKTRQILIDMQFIEFNTPYSVTRDRLFSGEARISIYYWGGMKLLIQPELGFEKRVRFKAGDLVNNMLNYGYGILYQRVWQSIQKQGLNPHISFLHAFQAGKPTLVYDMVEEFRQPFVDRAVFSLLTKGNKGADLNIDPKTGLLNKKTRDLVVKAVLERLSSLVNYRGEKKKCETIIELQIKNLVLFLQGEKIYKPFISGY